MPHLDLERLAAFDHDRFTDDEQLHLSACPRCRDDLDAMSRLVAQAAAAPGAPLDLPSSLTTFEAIRDAMRVQPTSADPGATERVVERAFPRAIPRAIPAPWWVAARRVAAALVLVAGGAVIGRTSVESDMTTLPRALSGALTVRTDETPLTIASATALLDRAQRDYERAALWLAANDSVAQSSEVYRARLAVLDEMMSASRAALREAPQDPLLNHYFLSAWAAREATLQQLSATLPVDKLVERY